MKITVSNDKELAEAAIKLSGYTKAELKKEYKKKRTCISTIRDFKSLT